MQRSYLSLVMVLAIFNPSAAVFSQEPPAEEGNEPPAKVATTEELVEELKADAELRKQLSYVTSLRVDHLFGPKSEFTFNNGGYVPSQATWQRWTRKVLKDQIEEEVTQNYEQFLKYAPALAKIGFLKGCKPAEPAEAISPEELNEEYLDKGGAEAHQYCNNRRVGTMFSQKHDTLVGSGCSLRPSYDAWRKWATGQGVPKKVRPTKPDEELYEQFIRLLPALTEYGQIKL